MRRKISWSCVLHIVCALMSLAIHTTCLAHDDPNATVPVLRAFKVDGPITVDGVLDEPFWREAQVGADFTDIRSGQPAAQLTKDW